MATIKVLGKYYAYKPDATKTDFEGPDVVEEEKFEIFLPIQGCESKKEYIDIIRESSGISFVEKSLYGKAGNDLRFFKFHENRRVVLNTKAQFDELLKHVKGEPGDPRIHIKLIPQKTLWNLKPGGGIEIQRATVKKMEPSAESMIKSQKIDSTIKELNGMFQTQEMENINSYRLGDDIYILCKCSKNIKARRDRKAQSIMREFKYEHYDNHNTSDKKPEKIRSRTSKKVSQEEASTSSEKSKGNQTKISKFFKTHSDRYDADSSSSDSSLSHKLSAKVRPKQKKKVERILSSGSEDEQVEQDIIVTGGKDVPYDPEMALQNPFIKERGGRKRKIVISDESSDPDGDLDHQKKSDSDDGLPSP